MRINQTTSRSGRNWPVRMTARGGRNRPAGAILLIAFAGTAAVTETIVESLRISLFDPLVLIALAAWWRPRSIPRDWTVLGLAYAVVITAALMRDSASSSGITSESIVTLLGPISGAVAAMIVAELCKNSIQLLRTFINAWTIFAVATTVVALVDFEVGSRSTALFRFPNELALYGFASVAVAALAWSRHVIRARSALLLGTAGAASVVMSGGRGYVLASAVFLACFVFFAMGSIRPLLRVAAVAILALAVNLVFSLNLGDVTGDSSLPVAVSRIVETADNPGKAANTFHVDNWTRSLRRFSESPILGHATENQFVGSSTLRADYGFEAHNTFLILLVQFGALGTALLLWAGSAVVRGYGPFDRGRALAAVAGMATGFFFHAVLQSRIAWLLAATTVVLVSERLPTPSSGGKLQLGTRAATQADL